MPAVVGACGSFLGTAGVADLPFLVGSGVVAAAGLLWYELGFITAGQAVPIS